MFRSVFLLPSFSVLALLALPAACADAGGDAASGQPSHSRLAHGKIRTTELTAGALRLGRAEAFFGVDSLSTAEQQYLTSGLHWSLGAQQSPLLGVTAQQTEARGVAAGFSSQRLLRAQNRVSLGHGWYLPQMRTQLLQVRDIGGRSALASRAARIDLAETLGPAQYTLSYINADPDFNALGSTMTAGEHGLVLNSRYHIGKRWQLSQDVRVDRPGGAPNPAGLAQRWVLSSTPDSDAIGTPWQLSASLGDGQMDSTDTPLALELAVSTARPSAWRLNTSLGWYRGDMPAPLDLPVAGTLWQVSASRSLNIAGFKTVFSPDFSLGGSRYNNSRYGSRTGLKLGLSQLSDNIDLSVDYRSTAWTGTPASDRGDVRLSLSYTRSIGSVLSALSGVGSQLRLPWQRRY